MKKTVVIPILLFVSSHVSAQNKYCEMQLTSELFSDYTAEISYGKRAEPILDSTGRHELKFYNEVAAINYMADQNWKFVSIYEKKYSNSTTIRLFFVKEPGSKENTTTD